MELNISEIENNANTNKPRFDTEMYEKNPEKYWEINTNSNSNINTNNTIEKPTKKVTFTNILNHMNLVVDKNGILQKASFNASTIENEQHNEHIDITRQLQSNTQPIDFNTKHSYIYNKYFKDYVNQNEVKPEVRVPKTIEEYKKMLIEDALERVEQQKRISQIKSTKLLFTTPNQNIINIQNIHPSPIQKNNLRNMNFN